MCIISKSWMELDYSINYVNLEYWVRKFTICESFTSICAFVDAQNRIWVRKSSICEDFTLGCIGII